jgi:hypothetical protein
VSADVLPHRGYSPDTGTLFNGAYLNDDGHGFAIVADEQLIVQRGMQAEPMIDAFNAARRQYPHGPALFHSRFGTHGARGAADRKAPAQRR